MFRTEDLYNQVDEFVKNKMSKIEEILGYVGENFANYSKAMGNYTDQTGNLRNSIGYSILNDGKEIRRFIMSPGTVGGDNANKALNEAIQDLAGNREPVLIGTAGQDYAAAVQHLDGYDVILGGATKAEELLKRLLKALSEG